ncbi:lipopolysaccharide core biosynthesis protein RfaZ [Kluyvera sichuanensis]|uniref:lipopolysaccharide core biosynthesis protein RfaZ n=1 Tax=Kluyvera sichuanensis TaxID=2725494 RepID=UPI003F67F318
MYRFTLIIIEVSMDIIFMTGIDSFFKWMCKTLYRTTHSKKYHHNKNLWPYFKVVRKTSGGIDKVYYKRKEIESIVLKTTQRAKPLIIMATGPSVKHIERTFFDDTFDYLGVNGAFSIKTIDYDWYVIIDRTFVLDRMALVKEIFATRNMILFCTYSSLESIFTHISKKDIHCHIKIFEVATQVGISRFLSPLAPIDYNDESFHFFNDFGFADNIDKAIFDYGTVAYPALQIACVLGYKRIYIVGLDMNNFNAPRFYETENDKLSTGLDKDFAAISSAFIAARSYCELNNIQVINLSPDSAIGAFPKMRWDRVEKAIR